MWWKRAPSCELTKSLLVVMCLLLMSELRAVPARKRDGELVRDCAAPRARGWSKACTAGTAQDVEAVVRELALAIIDGLRLCE